MSDVFYLNLPRSRILRGPADITPSSHTSGGYAGGIRTESLPTSDDSSLLAIARRAWPVAVGVTIGCALSIGVRLWSLRQRRRFTSAEKKEHPDARPMRQERRVYHAGMDGIPPPRSHHPHYPHDSANARDGTHNRHNKKNGEGGVLPTVMKKRADSSGECLPSKELSCDSADGNCHDKKQRDKHAVASNPADIIAHPKSESTSSLSSLASDSSLTSSPVFVTAAGETYRRVLQLGRGGFGTVFKCVNLNTGQLVAVKEVPLGKSHDNTSADELLSEFELLSNIEHPHIIRLIGHHVGHQHARLFLEWAAGGSLYDMMKQVSASSAGLHEGLVRSYMQQIISALQCLHAHGIIHRDLKPQNILVDHNGMLRLTDFGLSRLLSDEASAVETGVAGTPRYMARETILSGRFSYGSDIWALGAIMSELLTGKLPWSHLRFSMGSPSPAADAHPVQPIPALLHYICSHPEEHPVIPEHISDAAREFMEICFRPDPKDRGTATALLEHPFLRQEKCDANVGKPQNEEKSTKVGAKKEGGV